MNHVPHNWPSDMFEFYVFGERILQNVGRKERGVGVEEWKEGEENEREMEKLIFFVSPKVARKTQVVKAIQGLGVYHVTQFTT